MNNKVLILAMSCNDPIYISEEDYVLSTWGKDIIDKKYDNFSLYFFRSGFDNEIDEESHTIFVKANDGLSFTFEKTMAAYRMAVEYLDFDWIILTNTATVLNIPLLNRLVNSDLLDENKYYGCEFLLPLEMISFFRGNFIMLSKKIIREMPLTYSGTGPNDVLIFKCLLSKERLKKDFLEKMVQLNSIFDIRMFKIDNIGSNFAISTKILERQNSDLIKVNIVGCYNILKEDKKDYDLKNLIWKPRYVTTNDGLFRVEKEFDL